MIAVEEGLHLVGVERRLGAVLERVAALQHGVDGLGDARATRLAAGDPRVQVGAEPRGRMTLGEVRRDGADEAHHRAEGHPALQVDEAAVDLGVVVRLREVRPRREGHERPRDHLEELERAVQPLRRRRGRVELLEHQRDGVRVLRDHRLEERRRVLAHLEVGEHHAVVELAQAAALLREHA
ncbi:MAG: hypothetical protein R3A52_21410 [Polyangiales bacterium]